MGDAENHAGDGDLDSLEARWREEGTPRLLLKLAEEYRGKGLLEEAVTLLEEGVQVHADYLAARVALGRCRVELGRPAAAARALEWVVRHDPTQLVANKLLVRAYLDLGEPAKALDRLEFYSLLNESDPEIESLGEEIRRAETAGAEGEDGAVVVDESEATARATVVPAARESTGASGEGARIHVGAASVRVVGDPTPFPSLLSVDPRGHLAQLLSAGLLPVGAPEPVAPSVESLPAEEPLPGEPPPSTPPPAEPAPAEPFVASPATTAPEDTPSILDEAEPPPTATLARLYLDQGHLEEAETIFRGVLEADPSSDAARDGLEAVASRRLGPLRAADLLADAPDGLATVERKAWALRAYLARLTGRS